MMPRDAEYHDTAALSCRGICHGYSASSGLFSKTEVVPVLHDVSLTVPRGKCVALVGESGSGKSTLTRVLLGLERPATGGVFVDGEDVHAMAAKRRAMLIQPVFQSPAGSLNPALSVRENVLRPLAIHRLGHERERTAALRMMLDKVAIGPELEEARPAELSGGQQQRVALARALMLKPRYLILDEPTSALDVSVQALILNLLRSLQRDLDIGYLFVTHNFSVVAAIADRVAILSQGRIVEAGECAKVLGAPVHPETKRLVTAVLALNTPTVDGSVQP